MKWKADIHNWITDEEENIIAAVTNKEDMAVIAAAPEMKAALIWLLHLCSGVSKSGGECHITTDEWNEAWGAALGAVGKAGAEAKKCLK